MAFTSTHKTRVQTGFETLFKTMQTDDAKFNEAKRIIAQAFNELEQAKGVFDRQLERNQGWWANRGHKSDYEKNAKEMLANMVDELAALPVAGGAARSRQDQANIAALRDSLQTLVSKENVEFAKTELTKNAEKQTQEVQGHKENAQKNWGKIKEKTGKLAKLVPKGREMALTEPYYPEYMFEMHLPMAHGAGTELIEALNTTYATGKPPEHFKQFKSATLDKTLYDVMAASVAAHKGDKRAFFQEMKEAFTNSPDMPKAMVDKNFKSVSYLGAEQREALKLTIRDGKLYQGDTLFDTSNIMSKNVKGEVAFIITSKGEMLAAPHVGGEFHHSSFMSGEPVVAAGMMKVVNGKIELINNNSGHYKPQEHNMVQGLRSVPNLSSAFSATGRIDVKYSPSQKAPETFPDFMDRAAPLAEDKWRGIEEREKAYAEKHLKAEKPRLDAHPEMGSVVAQLSRSGASSAREVNDNIPKSSTVSGVKVATVKGLE